MLKILHLERVARRFVSTKLVRHGGQEAVVRHHGLQTEETKCAECAPSSPQRTRAAGLKRCTLAPVFRSRKQPVPYLKRRRNMSARRETFEGKMHFN